MKKLWKDPNLFAKPFLEIMIDIKYINNIVIVIDKRKPNKPFLLFFFYIITTLTFVPEVSGSALSFECTKHTSALLRLWEKIRVPHTFL